MTLELGVQGPAKVEFAVSPMQHLLIGLNQHSRTPLPGRRWWHAVRSRVPARALPLVNLVTANPYYLPDFLTPPMPQVGRDIRLADELDVISSIGTERIHDELGLYAELGPVPRPVAELLDGGTRPLQRLVLAVHAVYRACLADDWPDMVKRLNADITMRQRVVADRGTSRMLAGVGREFSNPARFETTIAAAVPVPQRPEDEADGVKLVLAPNLFLDGRISCSFTSPWQQPLFLYTPSRTIIAPPAGIDGLIALIGKGKAAALRAIGDGRTTTELAARLQISAPAASQHTATLRAAGLITTTRHGQRVLHTVTALGTGLLEANPRAGQ
ncbi:ArsR/SmtB family transcription factor [Kitasatospora viridis]|uniref:Helix-turn-helix protein n=1 Tax=Kitasatospora viridis TaxID=281105 RepID=A0A561SER8_9ACTN|nr:helix-turn-helix domain-containing protein [Kitasatospora viridis]TWF73365.1 helix-turn-helix protein [Kitasatospora viridis]